MKLILFLFMFLILGALLIISNNNLAFYKESNVNQFNTLYFEWLDGVYSNVQIMTGNLIKLEWLPEK